MIKFFDKKHLPKGNVEVIINKRNMKYKSGIGSVIDLLFHGTYKGFGFYVMSYGSHPCAYVEIPNNHKYCYVDYNNIDNIGVHGGLTYSENYLHISNTRTLKGWFIGWDYCHYGDYSIFEKSYVNEGKKYTTDEMIEDCKHVINQLVEV